MAKTTKSKASKTQGDDKTFEQALDELENLVESMESDQAPLDQLIDNYEKGTQLYDLCQKRLDNAQQRVDLIRDGDGTKKKLEPFDEENESAERKENSQANTQTDDGELF